MEQKAISSDLIRGHIDTIILHTLLDGDKFAQQISDKIDEKSNNEYKINQATLYSSLKRLESLKYVTSYWFDSDTGRRKYFKLTSQGKEIIDTNLLNWSHSRSIIDKLMDCESPKASEIKIVEKIIEVPVEKTIYIKDDAKISTLTSPQPATQLQATEKIDNNQQDVNFRNILSNLIKLSNTKKIVTQELQPINKEDSADKKLNFNETINSSQYNDQKNSNTGRIDFGDLAIKAIDEGYKLRVSSKDSGIAPGKIFISKLNLCSSLIIYLVCLIEFLIISLAYKNILNLSAGITLGCVLLLSLFPAIRLTKYIKNPKKKSSKSISADKILTSFIIVFNLLIITVALNLLLKVNFSNINEILISLIIPCIIFLDILLYYITKFFISKLSYFQINKQKNK